MYSEWITMSEMSKTIKGIPDYNNTFKSIRGSKKTLKIKIYLVNATLSGKKFSELKQFRWYHSSEISLTEVQLYSMVVTHGVCAFKTYCWRNLWKLADKLMCPSPTNWQLDWKIPLGYPTRVGAETAGEKQTNTA